MANGRGARFRDDFVMDFLKNKDFTPKYVKESKPKPRRGHRGTLKYVFIVQTPTGVVFSVHFDEDAAEEKVRYLNENYEGKFIYINRLVT